MGLLDCLFKRGDGPLASHDSERIDRALERILTTLPRLRMARRSEKRLRPAVTVALRYADEVSAALPAPHEASLKAWASDPCIRAFFATAEDLPKAFSRAQELRAYFDRNPGSVDAYAALGMAMTERHVLGVALDGDTIRTDVAQTTLCFADHRARICAATESGLREEIARRLLDQLALEGLSKLAADCRELVEQGRALLQARLALMQRGGMGVCAVVGGAQAVEAEELERIHAQIDENANQLAALRVPTEVIELELQSVCEVLSDPSAYIYVTKKRVRIDLMNVVQESSTQAGHEIEFDLARISNNPPVTRAFALVCFPRAELLADGLHIDAAMRAL